MGAGLSLLAVAGDIDALIADIRLRTPLSALAAHTGWRLVLRSLHDCTQADLAAADVLIVQRGMSRRACRLMRRARAAGAATVYEIDDLLTALPAHVSNHAAVQARQAELQQCLAQADLVTVSTARLGQALGCARWACVPNSALPALAAPLPMQDPGKGPVSLVFASMEHLASDFIFPALRGLQQQHPGAAQIVVFGPPAEAFVRAGLQVRAMDLMPRAQFIETVRSLPNPLAVIPLEDSPFAACKSAIKWFEYSQAGVPCLCSDVPPYADVVQTGQTGALVANTPAAWREALTAAVLDPAWRAGVAARAQQVVQRKHTLQHSLQAWHDAVQAARAHRQRHPPEAVPWLLRCADRALHLSEDALLGLRRFNRQRLARRKAVRGAIR
jgi:hypothetical protein